MKLKNKITTCLKKNFLWFLLLVILIILPSFVYIYDNLDENITTNLYELGTTEELTKESKIIQKIYIPGKMYKFGLMFENFGRKCKGLIKITFEQDNKIIEKILDISKLNNGTINNIKMNFSKLKKGEAVLKIESIDGTKGQSVSLVNSEDISLGTIIENGITKERGLVYSMGYYKFDRTIKFQILFLFFSVLCFLLIIKLSENENKNTRKIYIATSFMIFFLINVKIPILTFYAEPYSEVLHNFLVNALYRKTIDNIFISDFGYWPLFQRIVTLFIVKIFKFNLKWTTYFLQNIGIYIITLIGSMFVLKDYKKYGNLLLRLVISLVIGGGVTLTSTVEAFHLFNISYYGIVGIILISLLDLRKLNTKRYLLLMLFSFFVCISKSYYIVLFPIGILILGIFFKKTNKKEKIFLYIIIVASFMQFIYMKINNNILLGKIDILNIFKKVLHKSVLYYIYLFYPEVSTANIGIINMIFFGIVIFLFSFFIYTSINYKNKESIISIALIFLIWGVVLLNILYDGGVDTTFISNFEWFHKTGISVNRRSIFIIFSLIILLILLIRNFFIISIKKLRNKKLKFQLWRVQKNIVYSIFFLFLLLRFFSFDNNKLFEKKSLKINEIMGDWNKYYKFFAEEDAVLPFERSLFLAKENMELYFYKYNEIRNLKALNRNWITNNFYKYYEIHNLEKGDEKKSMSQIHEISFENSENLKYVYVQRMRANNKNKLKILGYNEKNEIVFENVQINKKDRLFVGFKKEGSQVVKKIKFFTEEGKKAYVKDGIYFGIKK